MFTLLNHIKLAIWSAIYYKQKNKSEIIYKIIIKNIKDSGCVVIKFVQWILPKIETIYDIDINDPQNSWFLELEELYDNCNYHSIEYTKQIYKKEFNREFDKDYTIDKLLASGSIGQVYKLTDKINNEKHAMKVLHPNVDSNLFIIKFILNLIYSTPILNDIIKYYIPIDIKNFINDFKIQTNLINEGNNCMFFNNKYKNNDIYVIPEVRKVSKDILIMSYESGVSLDKSDISDYRKEKSILFLKTWIKNNQYKCKLMHGDLHKGNWKVRTDGDDLKIVIYDFGFCWYMPDYMLEHEINLFVDKSLITPIRNIENFAKACHILINKKSSLEMVKKTINKISEKMIKEENYTKQTVYDDPIFLMKILLEGCRTDKYLMDSFSLNSVIVHTQTTNYLTKYDLVRKNRKDNYFEKCILDIINICDTYGICEDYSCILKEEYKNTGIVKKELFESVIYDNSFLNSEKFKEMATYKCIES